MFVSIAAFVGVTATLVHGHGRPITISANGKDVAGSNPYVSASASENKAVVNRVMYKNEGTGAYVLPHQWNDPSKMSCEGSASSGAPNTLEVSAGSTVSVAWVGATDELKGKAGTGGVTDHNPWVHAMGTVQDYITSCNGACADFDATNAGWTKLAGDGLDMSQSVSDDLRNTMAAKPETYYPKSGKGLWGMAKFVQDGSKRDVTIPKSLKAGEYILRQELGAVHNPLKSGDDTTGPQLYITCIQLKVTGDGSTDLPSGTKSSELYETDGDFAKVNVISGDLSTFSTPGPAVWDQASSGSSSSSSGSNNSESSSSEAAATTTAQSNNNAVAATTAAAASSSSSSSGQGKKCSNKKRRSGFVHKKRLHAGSH